MINVVNAGCLYFTLQDLLLVPNLGWGDIEAQFNF